MASDRPAMTPFEQGDIWQGGMDVESDDQAKREPDQGIQADEKQNNRY